MGPSQVFASAFPLRSGRVGSPEGVFRVLQSRSHSAQGTQAFPSMCSAVPKQFPSSSHEVRKQRPR
eukprot:2017959-Lingulodinium_polyedra.AAC.1